MAIMQKVSGSSKKFYTRQDDEAILALKAEGKSNAEVAKVLGHSINSITYRITQVLMSDQYNSLDEIKYKGTVVSAAPVSAPTSEV